jgi:hypothetical protein
MSRLDFKSLAVVSLLVLTSVPATLQARSKVGGDPPVGNPCTTPPPKRFTTGDRNEVSVFPAITRAAAKDCNGGGESDPPGNPPPPIFDPICGTRCQQN